MEDLFWGPGQVGVRFWEKGRDGRGQNSLFPLLSPTPVAFNKQKATVYSTNMYKEILPPSRGALEDRGTGLRPPPFFWGAGGYCPGSVWKPGPLQRWELWDLQLLTPPCPLSKKHGARTGSFEQETKCHLPLKCMWDSWLGIFPALLGPQSLVRNN